LVSIRDNKLSAAFVATRDPLEVPKAQGSIERQGVETPL
jgi:hypothetical protein